MPPARELFGSKFGANPVREVLKKKKIKTLQKVVYQSGFNTTVNYLTKIYLLVSVHPWVNFHRPWVPILSFP